jgi:hypothetical protein
MAERLDFEHDQGATFSRRIIWKTDTANPLPVDVTGYSARMHVRRTKNADSTIVELTTENGRIALGETDGRVDLFLDAGTTTTIPAPATYFYDLEMVAGDGFVTRLIEGKLKVKPEVTR